MDNLRGALLMVLAMAGFALEDMFIKQTSGVLPTGQVLMMLGLGGGLVFAIIAQARGKSIFSRDFFQRNVMARNFFEMLGTAGYVLAFTLSELTTASAIAQAMPLFVTLGAAIFLGQEVGWRRWSAIGVGFIGVLIVIRPTTDGIELTALLAVIGTFGLSMRDVVTRNMPKHIDSLQVSSWAFLLIIPVGYLMMLVMGHDFGVVGGASAIGMTFAVAVGVTGYYLLVLATRIGDMAFIAPFRYARIIFALFIGYTVFDERPDIYTYVGAIIIISSGLYTLYRESRSRASHARTKGL